MDNTLLLEEISRLLNLFFYFASKQRKSKFKILYLLRKYFLYKKFNKSFSSIKRIYSLELRINNNGSYVSIEFCDKKSDIKKVKVFFITDGIKIWISGKKEEIMLFSIDKKKAMPFKSASLFLFSKISKEV